MGKSVTSLKQVETGYKKTSKQKTFIKELLEIYFVHLLQITSELQLLCGMDG